MLQFYKAYPIVATVSPQLSWSHYEKLITIKNKEERIFYEQQVIQNQWSVRKLNNAIKSDLYKKIMQQNKQHKVTPTKQIVPLQTERVFKETYNFEFLDLQKGYSERQLEDGLLVNVEKLLLEFGSDFSLVGRQRKIVIDQQIHAIDIEFYHRGIPCIILADLKIGRFKSDYVGQMNKYLNYYLENKVYPWEKPPVGLIICEDKGEEEVRYALGGLQNKIFVSEYKLKLPSEKEIKIALQKAKS